MLASGSATESVLRVTLGKYWHLSCVAPLQANYGMQQQEGTLTVWTFTFARCNNIAACLLLYSRSEGRNVSYRLQGTDTASCAAVHFARATSSGIPLQHGGGHILPHVASTYRAAYEVDLA